MSTKPPIAPAPTTVSLADEEGVTGDKRVRMANLATVGGVRRQVFLRSGDPRILRDDLGGQTGAGQAERLRSAALERNCTHRLLI